MSERFKNRMISRLQNPLGLIIIELVVIGIAWIFDKVLDVTNFWVWLAILGIVFVPAFFVNGAIIRYHVQPLDRFQNTLLDNFNHYKDRNHIHWLLTRDELVKEEENIQRGEEIWVVSPTLQDDLPPDGSFLKVVERNLTEGVTYKYFVPKTVGMQNKVDQLKEYHHKNSGKLSTIFLDEGRFFFLVAGFDVTIYNPLAKSGKEPIMFLSIPHHDGDRSQYQVRTNRDFSSRLIDRLKRETQ